MGAAGRANAALSYERRLALNGRPNRRDALSAQRREHSPVDVNDAVFLRRLSR
jgi:hypothetical protein